MLGTQLFGHIAFYHITSSAVCAFVQIYSDIETNKRAAMHGVNGPFLLAQSFVSFVCLLENNSGTKSDANIILLFFSFYFLIRMDEVWYAGSASAKAEHGVLWRCWHCWPTLPSCYCQQVSTACTHSNGPQPPKIYTPPPPRPCHANCTAV